MRLLMPFLALLTSACVTHTGRPDTPPPAPVQTTFTVDRDVVYSPVGWPESLKADVYRPQGAAAPLPAVLLIHGGGWAAPDRRKQMVSIAERLAKRGYVVMNVTYRFAPQYIYPAPVDDLREALKWLHANADQYGVDRSRVAAFGYSAGAHLAALLGEFGDTPDTRVQAVVAGGTPTDLRKYKGGKLVPRFLGGTQDQVPQQFIEASPVCHVKAGEPPVFLYNGSWDTLVPLSHAEDYKKLLDAAGIRNELYVLHGRGHVTAFLTDGGAVDAALEFLDRNLR